jgi:gliding motility-associated-like protein
MRSLKMIIHMLRRPCRLLLAVRLIGAFWVLASPLDTRAQAIEIPGSSDEIVLENQTPVPNYTHFTSKTRIIDEKWLRYNSDQVDHPDALRVPAEQPIPNAIEILERRTQTSRYFVDADQPSRVFSQSAFGSLHYEKGGKWLSIDPRLSPSGRHVYEAARQPEPVGFDTKRGRSFLKTARGTFYFNTWKLYGRNGKEVVELATANWERYTAGDDGLFVEEIFLGIDAEMTVHRGEIKTNLIVKKWAFPIYKEILLEDTFSGDNQTSLHFTSNTDKRVGVGEIEIKSNGNSIALIEKAIGYSQNDPSSVVELAYQLNASSVAVLINAKLLLSLLASGPVVIDPRVTGRDSRYNGAGLLNSFNASSDNVSNCSVDFNEGCSYSWPVEIPARVTVTNVIFIARLETIAPCTRDKMRFRYGFGPNLCGRYIYWSTKGDPTDEGITGGDPVGAEHYNTCFQPECTSSYIPVHLSITRNCVGAQGCGDACVRGTGPFVITVEGHTLELESAVSLAGNQICHGEETQLVAVGSYGVPSYTYEWTPGGLSGDTVRVSPTSTTNYTLRMTDVCGESVTNNVLVAVSSPVREVNLSLEDCGVIHHEGKSYEVSQTLVNSIKNQWGCDSLVQTVQMIVHPLDPKEETERIDGCDFVDYEGTRYLESTVLNQTFLNSNGCDSVYRQVRIFVEDFDLRLTSSIHPDSLFSGQSIELSTTANKPEFKILSWEPDGLFSDQNAVKQSLTAPRDMTVTVTASTDDGCFDAATIRLLGKEIPSASLYPTSFSPNGDGKNDVWRPVRNVDQIEIWVYNRWGECVFHSNGADPSWDGTFKGARVAQGSYAFKFIAYGKFESSGVVNVLY